MHNEIQSLTDNQLWNMIEPVPDIKIVGYKWIFKNKIGMDRNMHTFKARLVQKFSLKPMSLIMRKYSH